MTYLNCDNEEIIQVNRLYNAKKRSVRLDRCSSRVTSFVIVESRVGGTQPLTESSAAAIGHSKQRRGWQRTVSRWIRPCAPRAPILPKGDLSATWRSARRVTAFGLGAGRRSHWLDAASARSRSPE